MSNFFNKTENIISLEDKYNYVKNHFKYWTMNSWNRLRSIANNVKIYNLGLTKEQESKIYDLRSANIEDFDELLNDAFVVLCREKNLRNVFFNGRSDGYIVIADQNYGNGSVLGDLFNYDNIEDFKQELKDYYSYTEEECQESIKEILERDFEIVKNFDILCDELRDFLIENLDNFQLIDEEVTVTEKHIIMTD